MSLSCNVIVDESDALVALDITASASTCSIWRVEPGPIEVPLRGSPFAVSGSVLVYDHEPPFDTAVSYHIVAGADDQTFGPETLDSNGLDWLKPLGAISRQLPVQIESFPEKSSEARASLYPVMGRSAPVVVTDVMDAYTGRITVLVEGDSDRETLESSLLDGFPWLLHSPPERGEDRFYFVVMRAQWQRLSEASNPDRLLVLDVVEVDASGETLGTASTSFTWDTLDDSYPLWTDVSAAFATWRDVQLAGLTVP